MAQGDTPGINMEEDEVDELFEDDIVEEVTDDILVVEEGAEDTDDEMGNTHGSAIPPKDDADLTFTGHMAPVFCCDIDPKSGNVAITGGQDDKGIVWDIKTGNIILECTDHKDSVVQAVFSHDGMYVATGDMAGLVQVWRISTKTLVWSENIGYLSWMKWHHGAHVLLAAASNGEVYLWKIPSGECKMLPNHGSSSDCGTFMPDGRRAVVGYSDGSIKMFDLKSGSSLGSLAPGEAHSMEIVCINVHHDNNLIVAASADSSVTLIKAQPMKVIARFDIKDLERSDERVSIEGVAFCRDPSLSLVAAATLSGNIYIWDVAKQALRHRIHPGEGVTKLLWDRSSAVLYSGYLGGAVRAHDTRSGICQFELFGHTDDILDITLSVDGSTILTTSDDTTARVFSVNCPDR